MSTVFDCTASREDVPNMKNEIGSKEQDGKVLKHATALVCVFLFDLCVYLLETRSSEFYSWTLLPQGHLSAR